MSDDGMPWRITSKAAPAVLALADRHYSRQRPGSATMMPPGRSLVMLTEDARAVWGSLYQLPELVKHAWPEAWMCTIFRNEGAGLSSALIRQAIAATLHEWGGTPPPDGFITFVDEDKVASAHPGYCFKRAGFELVGRTSERGLLALRLAPLAETPAAPALASQYDLFQE